MFRRPLTWFLLSLLLFAGAVAFWRLGEQWAGRAPGAGSAGDEPQAAAVDTTPRSLRRSEQWRLLSADAKAHFSDGKPVKALRLSNADLKPSEWTRRPTAILLENARIDTTAAAPVVPQHLRAQEGDGTFIVQSRGPIGEFFRTSLRQAGANIIAYIPNNAYLVRLTDEAAQRLGGLPGVQAVLPYEPYYKLKTDLLRFAVNQWEMPLGEQLNVAMFADARDATIGAVVQMGAKILAEEPSPFGPVITIQPPGDSLVALAGLPGVQVIEPVTERVPANDLGRARIGVSVDSQATNNWLDLTGTNVMVNVNDSGVDATHPDLQGRMFAANSGELRDANGHGTHVIGTIAGNGAMSSTVSNANGSINPGTNGQFRGGAPGASVFVQHVSFRSRPGISAGGPTLPDSRLQETAARTNALISNNSWHYGGNSGYDLASARYDAATRDAIPAEMGSQPLLFIFAAGNAGGGDDGGQGGEADSIRSPGNAKNVLTVGAIEQLRYITNDVVRGCKMTTVTNDTGTNTTVTNAIVCITNQPWAGQTDSDDEVASFSSRGNVGVGVEGENGRFKPDVVAPGAWVVSTRSQQWDEKEYFNPTNYASDFFEELQVKPGKLRNYSIYLPPNAVQVWIDLLPNSESPSPFPGLPIYVKQSDIPTTNSFDFIRTNHVLMPPDNGPSLTPTDASWNYSVGTTNAAPVWFNLQTTIATTNDNGNEFEVRSNLNNTLGPWYRYESGSSMSAGYVSGTLALMQEFFEQRLSPPVTNSPAMMKALLINGARSLASQYDFQVQTLHNFQGWGRVNLPTTLPALMTNYNPASLTGPMLLFDQNSTNALATGDRHLRQLQLTDEARTVPLRVTLVWTDPPGNPAAGVKLVNDLDLVVTNLDTGEVYFGNDIQSGRVVNQPWNTNNAPTIDVVNNVENVFLEPPFGSPLGTNYAIAVIGSRVNVNAVTGHTNDTVQDYALVISCGDGDVTDPFTFTDQPNVSLGQPNVTFTTNLFQNVPGITGTLLLGQHVGANTPLMGLTNGMTNQWHFYVLTNTESYTNAAFVTFLPYTLSIPRLGVNEGKLKNATRVEADIDLYVSLNPALTNLDPLAIATADRARARGGTEVIVYSNAVPGGVYYVGVKAEDQMAAEYGFLGVFSLLPFNENDNGNLILRGFPVPTVIPDGSPDDPGAAFVFALAVEPITVRRVIVTNTVTHEQFGDLIGSLSHNMISAALNNHTFPPGDPPPLTYTTIYEDNEENDIRSAERTDGPGSLRDFVGEEGIGLWLLQMVDDANSATGSVDFLSIRLEPQMIDDDGRWRAIQPFSFSYDFVDVPANASNLTVCVWTTNNAPLELYVRRGDFPTRSEFDKKLDIAGAPGDCLTINRADLPPLSEGRYYIGIYNPTASIQFARLVVTLDLDLAPISPKTYTWKEAMPLTDEAVTTNAVMTNAWLHVTNDSRIASVEVGVRIDHERVSDLALTLVSPKGTRVLLTENRGWTNDAGLGSTYSITNTFSYSTNKLGPEAVTNVIDTGLTAGTLSCVFDFGGTLPDQMTIYYEGVQIYDTGMTADRNGYFTVDFGPGSSTLITIIMNEFGNAEQQTMWAYDVSFAQLIHNYVMFTENTNLTTIPMKFGTPPFTPPTNRTVTFISDFEPDAAGDYVAPQTVDGWRVQTTNPVTVIDDATNANTGTKYLALHSGEILRTLPTLKGRDYRLDFAHRRLPTSDGIIHWWPGEGSALDAVGTAHGLMQNGAGFAVAEVGHGLVFDGTNDLATFGTAAGNFGTNDFAIEFWIRTTATRAESLLCKRAACGRGSFFDVRLGVGGVPGAVTFEVDDGGTLSWNVVRTARVVNDGSFHHVALVRSGTVLQTYVDGLPDNSVAGANVVNILNAASLMAGRSPCVGTDGTDFFRGTLDELTFYNRALSGSEVQSIYVAGAAGKCAMETPPAACQFTCAQPALQFGNFNVTNGLTLTSNAMITNGVLRLTAAAEDQVGNAWALAKQQCAYGFDTTFHFQITDLGARPGTPLGADGIAFSIQNVGTTNISEGWALGATSNHVTVFFNTFLNWPGCTDYQHCDVSDNSIAILTNQEYVAQTDLTPLGINLSDGNVHEARIASDGQALTVWLDGMLVLANVPVPGLSPGLDTQGLAWVGFGAATGWGWQNQDILDWSFCSKEPVVAARAFVPGVVTNIFGGTDLWKTNSLSFTAYTDGTPFGIAPVTGQSGTLLDTFVLTEFPGPMYFLPEETLKALADENASGDWELEILDTRTGATNAIPPELISWQLRFVFQNVIPIPGVLSPGEAKTNSLPAGLMAYYVVDVPSWASFATNSLLTASGPVNLWFNQTTPPSGTNAGDFLFLGQQTIGSTTLSASTTPPLQPGQRYYLGVQNTNAAPVTYAVQVDFNITALANGVAVAGLIEPASTPRYFSYDVSTNAAAVTFALANLSGDAQLVARRGAPVPTLLSYDYGSFNSGSQDEQILVLTNSVPVALAPGRWYLGVFNVDATTVVYTITATEHSFTAPIITLTNGIPYASAVTANGLDYYRYVVSGFGARAQFEINSPSGDLTLVARKGWPPPDLGSFDYRSVTPGTNDELIVLFSNSSPVPLSAGDWLLSAANNTGTPVSYSIKATEWVVSGQPIAVTGASVTSTNVCLTWGSLPGAHYFVQGLTDLGSTNWITVSPTITAVDYSTTWCLGLPSPCYFFRVTEGIVVGP